MLARELMSTDVFSVDENKDFNSVEIMAELRNIRHIPVVDADRRLVGILSIRDLLAHLTVAGASHFVPIHEVMHRKVIVAAPDTPAKDVAELMLRHNIGCIPIVDDGELVGMISERDFVKAWS